MPLNVKTITHKPGEWPKCGLLWDPDLEGAVHNDEELYTAVEKHGSATVIPFKDDKPLELEDPQTMSAAEFCAKWRGD